MPVAFISALVRPSLNTLTRLAAFSAGAVALAVAASSSLADGKAFIWDKGDAALEWGPCPDFFPEGCGLAVLQGNPEDHNADVLLRLPGHSVVPHHWHTSAERMVLISGEFHVTYDDQPTAVMRQGTYAYGPAKLPHVAECKSTEPCLLFIAFEEPVDALPVE
jgi:quercetin dioxygenase-like cupin family protein